ncbi:MAG: hypothetical protein ACM30G_14550 [Micromonosporaceae bacterium]
MQPHGDSAADDVGLRVVFLSYADGLGVPWEQAERLLAEANLSRRPDELRASLLAFTGACGAQPHGCIYLSSPITTGRNHIDRLVERSVSGRPVQPSDREGVITANKQRARTVANAVRAQRHETVIDPTALIDVPDWKQNDYHELWVAVIEQYAKMILFVDDWQYSVGCTTEFRAALRLGLPLVDQRFEPLTYREGVRLLEAAVAEVDDAPGSGHLLRNELAAIRALLEENPDLIGTGDATHGGSREG